MFQNIFKTVCGVAGAAAIFAGCASSSQPVARHSNGLIAGVQGGGSEVVFPGAGLAGSAYLGTGEEAGRRDLALGPTQLATLFDIDSWPQPLPPSLADGEYLSLPRHPNLVLYFNTPYAAQRYLYRSGY